jgi:ABC-type branched-subunit amino acid transport system substrate-binding protein
MIIKINKIFAPTLIVGWLALLLFLAPVATTQSQLSPQESRGKQIYLLGTSKSGKDILAYVGEPALELPGSTMPCANCHGTNGQGKPEGGIDPSNITWETLTKPYGVTHTSGRKHPAYTMRALELAITRGLDPAGNKLLSVMPRYQMTKEDLDDLLVYLKRLGADLDPGISEEKIVIGAVVPASGALAEMGEAVKQVVTAYFAEVNSQGGVYNRRLELKSAALGEDARGSVERLIKDEKLFAMVGNFIAGAEKDLVPLFEQLETPVIGPMTLDPQPGNPVNRRVFYLLSGNAGQARALVSFFAKRPEAKGSGIAVIYQKNDLNSAVVDAIKLQSEKESLKPPQVYEYAAGAFSEAEAVKAIRASAPAAVFFTGGMTELLAFMKEAETANWFPQILLQGTSVGAGVFDAPAGFAGKVFFTSPTSPADQTADGLKEFRALAEKYKLPSKHLAAQVTAFSSARVLVEALKRAGKDVSRESFIQALEGFYDYATGLTPAISYGPNRRIGAMGAYVVTVDLKEKKFVPVGGFVVIN